MKILSKTEVKQFINSFERDRDRDDLKSYGPDIVLCDGLYYVMLRNVHASGWLFDAKVFIKINVMIEVDIKKVDEAWRLNREYYIGENCTNAKEGKIGKFKRFLKTGKPIHASEINYKNGSISFTEGQHRFATIRDMGKQKIMVTIDKQYLNIFKKKFQ